MTYHKIDIEHTYESVIGTLEYFNARYKSGKKSYVGLLPHICSENYSLAQLAYAKHERGEMVRHLNITVETYIEMLQRHFSAPEPIYINALSPISAQPFLAALVLGDVQRIEKMFKLWEPELDREYDSADIDSPDFRAPYLYAIVHLGLGRREAGRVQAQIGVDMLDARLAKGDILYTGCVERGRLVLGIAEDRQDDIPQLWSAALLEYIEEMRDDGNDGPDAAIWFEGLALLRLNQMVNEEPFKPNTNDPRTPLDLIYGT